VIVADLQNRLQKRRLNAAVLPESPNPHPLAPHDGEAHDYPFSLVITVDAAQVEDPGVAHVSSGNVAARARTSLLAGYSISMD